MPLTPQTWLDAQTANLSSAANSQPEVVQLASGHILVAWTADSNPLSPGDEIVGRIYDPLGNPLTLEIQLNVAVQSDEQDVSFAALPNGGFVVAYEDNGSDNDLRYTTYDFNPATAALTEVRSGFIVNDAPGGAVPNSPSIAATSNTNVGVVWRVDQTDGAEDLIFNTFNPQTGGFNTEIPILDSAPGEDATRPSIAALDNGNYVIMYVSKHPGADNLILQVMDGGANGVFGRIVSNTAGVTEFSGVDVTALSGGRWAAVWRNADGGQEIYANAFEADGSDTFVPASVSQFGDSANEVTISSLDDGGFVVMYDNDTDSTIEGLRFASDRSFVGNRFTVNSGSGESAPDVFGLADGRFVSVWDDAATIEMQIFDVRDVPNSVGVYSPDGWSVRYN